MKNEPFDIEVQEPYALVDKQNLINLLEDMYADNAVPLLIIKEHPVLEQFNKGPVKFIGMMLAIKYNTEFKA